MGSRRVAQADGRISDHQHGDRRPGGVSDPDDGGERIGGWPDWRGEIAAIIASGPSAKKADIGLLRGRAKVIAIKENVNLCPWADVVYGCDRAWWEYRRGLPEFKGIKISWASTGFEGVKTIKIAKGTKDRAYADDLHFDGDEIGGGRNSGFQALNLALKWGARRVILIGFDMTDRSGVHWYGRNNWPNAGNPMDHQMSDWAKVMDASGPQIRAIGADVVNTSTISRITAFRRATIEQALKEWA